MKKLTKSFYQPFKTYFEELPQSTQLIVREALESAADDRSGPEGFKTTEEAIESIECKSRDGFIAFSHNCGGLVYQNFCDLRDYWGGGYTVSHKEAQAEIERQIELGLKYAQENTYDRFKDFFDAHGVKKESIDYCALEDLGKASGADTFQEPISYIQDQEIEQLGGAENTIMHELRFMYHGKENGLHSASVSAAVNTEGPYHRSCISWAPKVFCEGAKEVEITWRTNAELKKKLRTAFAKVSKAIF